VETEPIFQTLFDPVVFRGVVWVWFGLGAATFVALLFVTAPYGRHSRSGWGPTVDARLGWMAMELPAAVAFPALLLTSGRTVNLAAVVFLAMWEIHYLQRALVYPFLLSRGAARMPLTIPVLAAIFNLFNAYLQGGWLFRVGPGYGVDWLRDPRFVLGAALFLGGLAINWHSDAVLRRLRKAGETGYKVPHGGLFRWVSCPNYLGEVIEWAGWAVATWSLPGAAFACWTAANLAPRAVAHHRWYRQRFPEYPNGRGAILPAPWRRTT
jgi:hypothetical protein